MMQVDTLVYNIIYMWNLHGFFPVIKKEKERIDASSVLYKAVPGYC